jgi:hypothetical protein
VRAFLSFEREEGDGPDLAEAGEGREAAPRAPDPDRDPQRLPVRQAGRDGGDQPRRPAARGGGAGRGRDGLVGDGQRRRAAGARSSTASCSRASRWAGPCSRRGGSSGPTRSGGRRSTRRSGSRTGCCRSPTRTASPGSPSASSRRGGGALVRGGGGPLPGAGDRVRLLRPRPGRAAGREGPARQAQRPAGAGHGRQRQDHAARGTWRTGGS